MEMPVNDLNYRLCFVIFTGVLRASFFLALPRILKGKNKQMQWCKLQNFAIGFEDHPLSITDNAASGISTLKEDTASLQFYHRVQNNFN